MPKRHHKWEFILLLVIALGAFYTWGKLHYQRDHQINRMVAELQQPKADITSYIVPSNPDIEVNRKTLEPLQAYFKENKTVAKRLARDLKAHNGNGQIGLIRSGRYFLLFPKYQLRVEVYHPQVKSNHLHSQLTVNGKNLGKMDGADNDFYQDLGLVFPGRYHLAVKTKVQGRKLTADSITNIWSNRTVNMMIKTGTFQIRSVPKGIVYINDHRAKKLDDNGQATFKNYPLAKGMELFIQTSYAGRKIRSEKVKNLATAINPSFSRSDDNVSDYGNAPAYNGNEKDAVYQDVEGDYIVNPHWLGLVDQAEAAKILAVNYLKADYDSFEKDKDNASFKLLKKQNKVWAKGKKKLKVEVKITQILPAGKNYSLVNYQVIYRYRGHHHKRVKKTVQYKNAMFHQVKDQGQLIEKLGTKIVGRR